MGLNINAGSMRHIIEWYQQGDGTDIYGEPVGKTKVFDTTMANVRFTSGSQLQAVGAVLTDEVITVLAWFDNRVDNSLFIKYENRYYEIEHIKPDELRRGMIITARVERDG